MGALRRSTTYAAPSPLTPASALGHDSTDLISQNTRRQRLKDNGRRCDTLSEIGRPTSVVAVRRLFFLAPPSIVPAPPSTASPVILQPGPSFSLGTTFPGRRSSLPRRRLAAERPSPTGHTHYTLRGSPWTAMFSVRSALVLLLAAAAVGSAQSVSDLPGCGVSPLYFCVLPGLCRLSLVGPSSGAR